MVKLADTLDLGSNAKSVQVQVLSSVPTKRRTFCPSFSMSVDGLATKLNIVGKLCLQPAFAADRKQRGAASAKHLPKPCAVDIADKEDTSVSHAWRARCNMHPL